MSKIILILIYKKYLYWEKLYNNGYK